MLDVKSSKHLAYWHVSKNIRRVLKAMHGMNLIHGDIKPENIIQYQTTEQSCHYPHCKNKYSHYYLVDFGTCQFIEEGQGSKTKTRFFGTRGYAGQ